VFLSRSGLTRLVDRLAREGLVERRSCPSDLRGQLALITDRGREVFAAARATHLEGVRREFLGRLSQQELADLAELWARFEGPDIPSC
jgi:DNA-binding MarR family transcriptional regulator